MAGGPERCRANARQCIEMAAEIMSFPELKDTFRELAARWTRLATELEQSAKRKRAASRKRKKAQT
jgi:hypothetical protein